MTFNRWRQAFVPAVVVLILSCACARPRSPAPITEPAFSERRFPTGGSGPFAVAVTDFNSDGRPDLAVSHAGTGTVSVLLGAQDGSFAQGPMFPLGQVERALMAADVNHDGHPDLVVANLRSNSVVILLGDGRGGATRKEFFSGLAPFGEDLADLDGDGNLDIVMANESDIAGLAGKGQVGVLFGDGSGDMPVYVPLQAGTYPADAKVADFDGDGHPDIAVVNWKSQDVTLFFGRGNRTFARGATPVPLGNDPAYTLAAADLNGDGHPDLVSGDLNGAVHLRINDGTGNFRPVPPLRAGVGLRCLIVTDLNGDKLPDIVTANTSADTVTIFYGKAGGAFAPPKHVPVGSRPRWVTAADLNGDGALDLVVTNGGSDDVSVLMSGAAD